MLTSIFGILAREVCMDGRHYADSTPGLPRVCAALPFLRARDVIDNYNPDILNFDDGTQFDFDTGGPEVSDLRAWLGKPGVAPQIMADYKTRMCSRMTDIWRE